MTRTAILIACTILLLACGEEPAETDDADEALAVDAEIAGGEPAPTGELDVQGPPPFAPPGGVSMTPTADDAALANRSIQVMEAELRNLLTLQEAHFADHIRYAGPAEDVNAVAALSYTTDEAVTIRIPEASDRGWSAVAVSDAVPGRGCAVYVGDVTVPATPGGLRPTAQARPICD